MKDFMSTVVSIAVATIITKINAASGQQQNECPAKNVVGIVPVCTGFGLNYYDLAPTCTCQCIDQVYSITYAYGNATHLIHVCALIAGEVCILDNRDPKYQPCLQPAICLPKNSTHGQCKCGLGSGTIRNGNGRCVGLHGSKCGLIGEIGPMSDYRICDTTGQLICQSKTCVCPSPKLIVEDGRCVAPVGQQCKLRSIALPNLDKEISCAKRLTCAFAREGIWKCMAL